MCIDNKYSKKIVLCRRKDAVNEFIKAILSEYNYCRNIVKKHFCTNLITSAEENDLNRLIFVGFVINCSVLVMIKSEIIVITVENIEVQHIGVVILILKLLKKFL